MRFPPSLALLGLLAASPAAAGGGESSLRCPGGIVALGDLKLDLLGKCGEPALREVVKAEAVSVTRAQAGQQARVWQAFEIERWTYDFGRNQLLRIVEVLGGRVRAIETGGRGYADADAGQRERPPIPIASCDSGGIRVGDRAYDLLARCGPPATRDVQVVERTLRVQEGSEVVERVVVVPVEVWAYHFGPRTLTRVVELEEGEVVRVETGGHGYPR